MTAILFLGSVMSASCDVQLLSISGSWRYQQTNNLDGQNWTSPAYDDTNWGVGNALLFVETNALVSPRNTLLTIGATTYYFRTHVNLQFAPTNIILQFSARIDDGAVFYLNGQEIQRIRMPGAPIPISYTNLASGPPPGGDAVSSDFFNVSALSLSNLVQGDNLIAVEVHQESTNSDDIVFGTSIIVKFTNSAPVIVLQPANATIIDGRSVFMVSAVDGNPTPSVQWFKDGNALSGATNASLSLSAAYPTNAGSYWLVASNINGTATSSNAVLTVLPDTNAPTIISALAQKNLTNVVISFSEPVMASTVTNITNYAVIQIIAPSNQLQIVSASPQGGSAVLLTTVARVPGINYSIQLSGIRDVSSSSNQIIARSEAALAYQVDLLPVDAQTSWRYFQAGRSAGTNWMAPDYDDSNWASGAALFGGGTPVPNTPDPVRTPLSLTADTNDVQTYYFRGTFDLPGLISTNSLRLHHVIDDGAIFYLNGSEVFSIGMPTNRPTEYSLFASRSVGTPVYEPSLTSSGFSLSGTNLAPLHNSFSAEVHQSAFGFADVAFGADLEATITHYNPKPQFLLPATVLEGTGIVGNQAQIILPEPTTNDLTLQLSSSLPSQLSLPAQVTIPAGATNVFFDLNVSDDALINGPRTVTLTAQDNLSPTARASLSLLDNETNTLQLLAVDSVSETNGTLSVELRFADPATTAISVSLASSDTNVIVPPASIIVPGGSTSVVFVVTLLDNLLIDGPRQVALSALVLGWPTVSKTVSVNDNETANLKLFAPGLLLEGSGTLTNAGKLTLSGLAASNIVVTLRLSDPKALGVPTNVTIGAGQSNAVFDITVPDDFSVQSNRIVTLVATASGFPVVSTNIIVIENDPDHIRFVLTTTIADTNTSIGLTLLAQNADGSTQTNYNLPLTILADGLDGSVPVSPVISPSLYQGQGFANFQVTRPGRAVRFHCLEYSGQSEAFNVVLPPFTVSTQVVSDIVWHEASQTLLASVPATGGIYSNRLVAFNPATGFVTNSYAVGFDPRQIEISPDGTYLYIALSNYSALQRFDLVNRQAGFQFRLATNSNLVRFAFDFCIPPGFTDAVVVAAGDRDSIGNTSRSGIWRYTAGSPVFLPNLSSPSGGWWLEALDSWHDIALTPPLSRADASGGYTVATTTNFWGTTVAYRDGQFFDNVGKCYSANSLALIGTYPNVLDQSYFAAIPELDPRLRRVFYLEGYFNFGSSSYQLKVYDRDLFQPLIQMGIPSAAGSPTRFLRCGTNTLAYVTGNGQLWIIRSDSVQPALPAAELGLSVSAVSSTPVVGTGYTFTLALTNAGPGIASLVRVTNSLPPNVSLVQATPTLGNVARVDSAFTWNVAALPAGSNAALEVTLEFNTGGWQTNSAYALGFEPDPIFSNNVIVMPLYVQLPTGTSGVFAVNYANEDIIYDQFRDRLLVSIAAGSASSQNNGIAVFNPYNGLAESFTPLGKKPAKLVASSANQYLYVSLPDNALVRRLTMADLSQNFDFALGGEYIYGVWYPFSAADMAAVPGTPGSLAILRVLLPGPMTLGGGAGIAIFDDGIMRPNVTDPGGSWAVEFDTDSGTLYGYSSGYLRRCLIDSNGVSFAEQYPVMTAAGGDLEYAAGHFFTTAGRMLETRPFKVDWVFSGAENATLVEPDASSNRVFYLVQNNGWQIRAYDISSWLSLGSVTIPYVTGNPTSLIRWGTNGLAFRTTSNQVYIVRWPQSPGADLALQLDGPDDPVPTGSDAVLALTLTNRGPASATNVFITNSFSPAVNLVSVSSTAGMWATNGTSVIWSVPILDLGTSAVLAFTLRSAQTGAVTVTSAGFSSNPDPASSNNTAVRALLFGGPVALDRATLLQLPLNDLIWSPSLGRLLGTGTTNIPNFRGALLSIDPRKLSVRYESALGSEAGPLAISEDDSSLCAAVDYGVSEFTLPGLSLTRRFLINPLDARYVAYNMQVVPGTEHSLVVGSTSPYNLTGGITVYDNGSQRTNSDYLWGAPFSLAFGDSSSFVYYADWRGHFSRYTIDPQGITLLDSDSTLFNYSDAGALEWGAGRLYSSSGRIVEPATRTLVGTIAGIPEGSFVRYDDASGRVFFLSPGSNQAFLSVFDAKTFLPVGGTVIHGITGALSSFVRWGADGFAATTSSGQLVVFRSSLIPTNPPADLAVSVTHTAPPYFAGGNVSAVITVTNRGPNPATDVVWTDQLPAGTIVASATVSAGTFSINSNTVSGNLATIAAGNAATINVTFATQAAGIITNQITAIASSIDPVFSNNVSATLLWIQPSNGLSSITSLNLMVKDLEGDPLRPLLYASFGTNAGPLADSVVSIDPANGLIGSPVRVGSDPGRLAASPDGQYLYVGLDGAGAVQKLALPAMTPLGSFPTPQNSRVLRMVVSPTNSDMIAIRGTPSGKTSLHVGGIERPGELSDQDLFAFSKTTGALYGCDGFHSDVKLYRLDTGVGGLSLLDAQPGKQSLASDLKASDGLLFFNVGMIVDPETTRVRAILPVPYNAVEEPDVGSGRVYYVTAAGTNWSLRAFTIEQGIEVGSIPLAQLVSAPMRLVRWGADGLAMYNNSGQLIIMRGVLVPTNSPADIAVSQTVNAHTATTNVVLNFSIIVTNPGPVTASQIVVTQMFSLPVTNVALNSGSGVATFSNSAVVWQPGPLPAGTASTLNVNLSSAKVGTLTVSASAYHELNDPFWGNNVALNAVRVTDIASPDVLQISLMTRDIVYDPLRDVIYASTPASTRLGGNLVALIDPATGCLQQSIFAGSEPSQLALSDDNKFLYVALDGEMGAVRLDLPTKAVDLAFPFGTNDMYYAADMQVRPANRQTIAASLHSLNSGPDWITSTVVYDHGVARPFSGRASSNLAFIGNAPQILGYVAWGQGFGLLRETLGPSGILTNEIFTTVYPDPGELKPAAGRFYSYSGQVIEPNIPVVLGAINSTGPVATDANTGRAFYLSQRSTNWELRAFDLGTFQALGTQTVVNVQGAPSSLIRCGADRFAFRTSANQLFILKSSLVPTNVIPSGNLTVSQTSTQDFTAQWETLRFAITITNAGPAASSNVLLVIKPPAPAASISLQLAQGTATNVNGSYLCTLGSVAPGQNLQILLLANITNTLIYSNFVAVSSSTPDPDLSDNLSLAVQGGVYFMRSDTSATFPLSPLCLAYDPMGRRLFAALSSSVTTNLLAWFDPETGAQLGSAGILFPATTMRISDDARYLYLASSRTGLVQRFLLPAIGTDLSFMPTGALSIASISVVPGSPRAIALTYWNSNNPVTAVFDDSIPRSLQLNGMPFTQLTCSTNGAQLYGYANTGTGGNSPDVFRMSITDSGLTLLDNGPSDVPWGYNHEMIFGQNRLVFANGNVLNPASWIEEGPFSLGFVGQSLAFAPSQDQIAFVTPPPDYSDAIRVQIYSVATRQKLADFNFGSFYRSQGNITSCGADRFAFGTASQLIFIRSSAIPAADLTLRSSATTNQVIAGDSFSFQITVSNAGPYAASGIFLTNKIPTGLNLQSFTLSQGTLVTNIDTVIASIGSLSTNASAALHLFFSPAAQAVGFLTNYAQVVATNLPDPILFNNQSTLVIHVLPGDSDHDGIPDDWELAHGLNPNDPNDASQDFDCDGLTNLEEYQRGSDPLVFDNIRLLSPNIVAPGIFEMTAHAEIGKTCTIESSTDLVHWLPSATFECRQPDPRIQLAYRVPAAVQYFRLRTDSTPPRPVLTMLSRSDPSTNAPSLQIYARPGYHYSLQFSSNLKDWFELTNFLGTTCSTIVSDSSALNSSARFYRISRQ